jgi:hypothetical protein
MDGYEWFWMIPMMFFWALVVGIVVYSAVRLAVHHEHSPHR